MNIFRDADTQVWQDANVEQESIWTSESNI